MFSHEVPRGMSFMRYSRSGTADSVMDVEVETGM